VPKLKSALPKVLSGSDLDEAVATLRIYQTARRFCIVTQSRANRSVESFIALHLGYSSQDETQTKEKTTALFKRVAELRKMAETWDGKSKLNVEPNERNALLIAASIIQTTAHSRKNWDALRENTEKSMQEIAAQLPIATWAKGVKGLGLLGVAVIIAEIGTNLNKFASVPRLWKRLGLAVIEGERQRKCADKDKAAAHGYNPKRRAEVYAFLSDAMMRHQWRGEKDGVAAHAIGPYGEVYGRRKAATLGKTDDTGKPWSDKHRDQDARRVASKEVIRDMFMAWRRATGESDAANEFAYNEAKTGNTYAAAVQEFDLAA
jgi:hypothetical protein